MDVRDIFAVGIEVQVRRVLGKMGEERVLRGLDAFETGKIGDWGTCFFAQAYAEEDFRNGENPERRLMRLLDLPTPVPIRIVYTLFDGIGQGKTINREQLAGMMRAFLDEQRPAGTNEAISDLIKSIDFSEAQNESAPPALSWAAVCSPKATVG